jgi:hypothetical protein
LLRKQALESNWSPVLDPGDLALPALVAQKPDFLEPLFS